MKDNSIFIFLLATGAALLIGFTIGFSAQESRWQQEIVNKGFAEWIVTGQNETQFKWKEHQ